MLTLIAALFTCTSVFLAGKKIIWAWPLGFVGSVIWVIFGLQIGDAGITLMNAFFCALYVYNFYQWRKVKP